ncbi:MAG: septum formation initiator family protein [Clostridia bacterium]|nr:septum formation initiator family protein [Clostridia bacterium]MBQ7046300.1 septum formation initiator family protein [Oscillospiraceae bacterium]
MSAAQKKKKKTYSTILTVVFIALVCYFVISFIGLQTDVKAQKEEIAQINAQVNTQIADNRELNKLLNDSELDDYVERIAREELGYVFPDERVYYDEQVVDN